MPPNMFFKGNRIRVIDMSAPDIPKRFWHRKGTVLSRNMTYSSRTDKAYDVKMDCRKTPFALYDDEMEVID